MLIVFVNGSEKRNDWRFFERLKENGRAGKNIK